VQFVVSVFTDITKQKELEQRKDHFISMASHELKTPLTILSAYTQLLREQFAAGDRQDAALYLSKMDDQITNLNKLVVDQLDISRMQAGQLELAQEAVDIDELVREVIENLQPTTTHRLLIEGAAQRSITGDRDRLGQVLIILLTNAIKYSPHADTVVVRVARTHHTCDMLTVSVQDFGIGIARHYQQRLFERFYRVLSKKDQTYPGLGIGLYIAHEIVQRHGGKMWVDSVEEKGSIFSFSLPIREA
jgi:signal transduction histidine kinase